MNNLDDYMYLNTLPYGGDYTPPERIVCAANKYGDLILAGVRHGCDIMFCVYEEIEKLNSSSEDYKSEGYYKDNFGSIEEQGFITSKYRWVSRTEAWKIALEQRQIVRLVGSQTSSSIYDPDTELFSENLY